jgi:hypothetical protein
LFQVGTATRARFCVAPNVFRPDLSEDFLHGLGLGEWEQAHISGILIGVLGNDIRNHFEKLPTT